MSRLARCENEAESALRRFSRNPDLFDLKQATRLSAASRFDRGEITAADVELEFAKVNVAANTEAQRRSTSARAAAAQEAAANAIRMPITCSTIGGVTICN